MSEILKLCAAIVLGYLLGSLNTALIMGKIYGKDITRYGSKSAGLTNALRVLGKTAAALVLVGDVSKGVVACLIGLRLGIYVHSASDVDCISLLAAGAGAMLGHNWPIYFGFKGGKGALTGLTVLFMFDWVMALICLCFFVVFVALTRYVSLATMGATVLFVAISFVPTFKHTIYFQIFACLIALMIIIKHRSNIKRLVLGEEHKLSF